MKIEDSLKTIFTLATRLKLLYKQLTYVKGNLGHLNTVNISDQDQEVSLYQFMLATTMEMMFLTSESILEEYDDILTHKVFPENENQIRLLKEDIKPAMKKFKQWNGRRLYRNTLVAHNLRRKDKTSIFSLREKVSINAPHYDNDFVIIYYLHVFMCHCLGKHFKKEILTFDSNKIIDRIDFTGEFKSLKEQLPLIDVWAKERDFEILELKEHLNFLFQQENENI